MSQQLSGTCNTSSICYEYNIYIVLKNILWPAWFASKGSLHSNSWTKRVLLLPIFINTVVAIYSLAARSRKSGPVASWELRWVPGGCLRIPWPRWLSCRNDHPGLTKHAGNCVAVGTRSLWCHNSYVSAGEYVSPFYVRARLWKAFGKSVQWLLWQSSQRADEASWAVRTGLPRWSEKQEGGTIHLPLWSYCIWRGPCDIYIQTDTFHIPLCTRWLWA